MNRRALALVSGAVLLISAGAWWLSAQEEPPPPVALAPTINEPPAPPILPQPKVVPPVALLPLPVAVVDAGLAEVEIEVFDDGVRQVGIRVEIEGPTGSLESRPTDVMGFARFSVAEGPWRVTQPERRNARVPLDGGASWAENQAAGRLAHSTPFEVRGPLTRLRLDLPRVLTVGGRVVDTRGRPVPGADVAWSLFDFDHGRGFTQTDALGRFELETTEENVMVRARLGPARSAPQPVKAPGMRELALEPWTRIRVAVSGPGAGPAAVRVIQRGVVVAAGSSEDFLWVPLGSVDVQARRNARGRIFSGKTALKVTQDTDTADVSLSPSPPLRGRLVDGSGNALGGLSVEAAEIELDDRLDGLSSSLVTVASTTSNTLGEFSLTPALRGSAEPVYLVRVMGLWRTKRQVMVSLDDAPLEVVVEPNSQ